MRPDEDRYREAERRLWDFFKVRPTERRVMLEPHGILVRIQEVGSGRPALFIHGGPNAGSTWAPVVASLRGFRCLLLDRPGAGLSEPMRLDATNLPAFADGLVGSTLDALSIDRALVVASSFGGYIAIRSAAAQPKRVERMVQLGCPAFVPGLSMNIFMRLMTVGAARRLMDVITPTPDIAKTIMQQIGHRESIKAGIIPDVFFDWYVSLQQFTGTMRNDGEMMGRLGSIFGFDASLTLGMETLRRVVAPTLFIWGDHDPFGSVKVAEDISSRLADAKLVVLPRAGHLPWLDAPEVVARSIAEFLRPTSTQNLFATGTGSA